MPKQLNWVPVLFYEAKKLGIFLQHPVLSLGESGNGGMCADAIGTLLWARSCEPTTRLNEPKCCELSVLLC